MNIEAKTIIFINTNHGWIVCDQQSGGYPTVVTKEEMATPFDTFTEARRMAREVQRKHEDLILIDIKLVQTTVEVRKVSTECINIDIEPAELFLNYDPEEFGG